MTIKKCVVFFLCFVSSFSFCVGSFATAEECYSTPSGKEIYRQIRMQDAIDTIKEVLPIVLIVLLVCVIIFFALRYIDNLTKERSSKINKEKTILEEKFLALSEKDKRKILRYLNKK